MHLLSLIKKYNFMKKQTQSYEIKLKKPVYDYQKEYSKRLVFAFACLVGMFLLVLLKQ